MPTHTIRNLNAISRTLLIPLYFRAMESQRPDALVRDPKAVELVSQLDCDFSGVQKMTNEQVNFLLRMREFDRQARAFLAEHHAGVIVDLGCGLDTRFERIDNGQVEWYDLDLPPVIALHCKLLEETPRYKMIAASALDLAWLDVVDTYTEKPFLFIAEGVLMYLTDAEMRRLVLALHERFPCAELVFDVASPLVVRLQNLKLARMKADFRMRWSLRHNDALEQWAPGIHLLETLGKGMVILRYRLGQKE